MKSADAEAVAVVQDRLLDALAVDINAVEALQINHLPIVALVGKPAMPAADVG